MLTFDHTLWLSLCVGESLVIFCWHLNCGDIVLRHCVFSFPLSIAMAMWFEWRSSTTACQMEDSLCWFYNVAMKRLLSPLPSQTNYSSQRLKVAEDDPSTTSHSCEHGLLPHASSQAAGVYLFTLSPRCIVLAAVNWSLGSWPSYPLRLQLWNNSVYRVQYLLGRAFRVEAVDMWSHPSYKGMYVMMTYYLQFSEVPCYICGYMASFKISVQKEVCGTDLIVCSQICSCLTIRFQVQS